MLRRGVTQSLREHSVALRGLQAPASNAFRTLASSSKSHGFGPRQRADFPRVNLDKRTFQSSSWKGKEKAVENADEDEDVVIGLLQSLMRKREKLMQRRDLGSNGEISKVVSDLDDLHKLWKKWRKIHETLASLLRMTSPEVEPDEEMRELGLEESQATLEDMDELRDRIKEALLPQDPLDRENAIVEIRPGIGGDESALFVGDVSRMYTRFCENLRKNEDHGEAAFEVEQLSAVPTDAIGATNTFKEIILLVKGKGAYGLLRNEAGVQRVQRVPITIGGFGRMQSSTIAVLVLPAGEGANGEAKSEVKDDIVDPKDVKVEVMRSRGAGGQHVNKTESAIRLTHEPTGVTVSMQDSRSQHQNRTKAWTVLRARLSDLKMREEQEQNRDTRRLQMGGMDRGDRIRTYNFPQDRVTEHRIPLSTNGIDDVMNGEPDGGLHYLIEAIRSYRQDATLRASKAQVDEEIVEIERAASSS